jgi:hypothetical protein
VIQHFRWHSIRLSGQVRFTASGNGCLCASSLEVIEVEEAEDLDCRLWLLRCEQSFGATQLERVEGFLHGNTFGCTALVRSMILQAALL